MLGHATKCELCLIYLPVSHWQLLCSFEKYHHLCNDCFDKCLKNEDWNTWECPCKENSNTNHKFIWDELEKIG